ncbi:MAG: hypothetical protein EA381_00375 [Planctomycetaceae bacterium]|nr:MAG: hypothetical protein EA381_00375 [Planctomycetaceae bacterium]
MNDRFWDDLPPANAPQNPYAPTATVGDAIPGMVGVSASDEQIRRNFLTHEASVQGVGALYLLGGVIVTIAGAGMAISLIASVNNAPPEGIAFGLGIGVAYFVMGIFQSWVGIGLRKLNPPARIGGIVLSCIGLLAIPIGTLISGYFLYLLASSKGQYVFSPEYTRIRKATPHIVYKTSIWVWVVLALFILLIVSMIVLAFSSGGNRWN